MQEEVTRGAVTLIVDGAKLSEQVFEKAVKKFLEEIQKSQKPKIYRGRQSLKQLASQNAGLANIEISDKNIKAFSRVAKKYHVDFALKKDTSAEQPRYANFLEDMGYKVFFKNINLNYSVGKVRWRPWAERGGRIATNTTTFNREILIVEKANDGKPFELHTSYDDKEKYYRNLRNPWLFLLLMFALFAVTKQSIIFGIFALVSVIPGSIYQIQIMKIRKEAKTQEW